MAVTPTTTKSERTRQRILESALALFAERGFASTTMRDIAARAEVSLGLTYRYFARKEDLAVALYERLSDYLQGYARELPRGPLAGRFAAMMVANIAYLDQHRETFLAVAGRAFDPRDDIGVLGPNTEPIRQAARASWELLVAGATDAPSDERTRAELADALYALDLLLVLVWTQDRSPDRGATRDAITAASQLLALALPFALSPFGAGGLARAAQVARRLGIGRPA